MPASNPSDLTSHFLSASFPTSSSSGTLPQRCSPGCKSRCPGWVLVARCARARCIVCWLFSINPFRKNGSLARCCELCTQFHALQWKEDLHAMGGDREGEIHRVIIVLGLCNIGMLFLKHSAHSTCDFLHLLRFHCLYSINFKAFLFWHIYRLFSHNITITKFNLFISALLNESCDIELD